MLISTKPIMSLIKTYGTSVEHYPAASPNQKAPWTPANQTTAPAKLRGILQRITADNDRDLPDGTLKAVMVLLIEKNQSQPKPGDQIKTEQQSWRITTILPILSDRHNAIVEAIITSIGTDQFGDSAA